MKRGEQFRRRIRHIRRVVSYEIGLVATAWLYLTRIHLPPFALKRIAKGNYVPTESIRYIPLIGILVGAMAGAVYLGAFELFGSKTIAVLLAIATSTLVASTPQPSAILFVLLNFHALLLVPHDLVPSVLIAANAFSRFAAASFIGMYQLVQPDGHGHYRPIGRTRITARDFVVLAILGIAPLLLVGNALFFLLIPLLWVVRNVYGTWFIGKTGGYTNDYLNLTQQLVESCCYLLVVIGLRYPLNIG
jgi:cobalamin synthase